MTPIQIRSIEQQDNHAIANVIRSVLVELDVPKVGTAYADPELDRMFETYSNPKSVYFVLEKDGAICGGAGIAPLDGDNSICELQKMYFLNEVRGQGFGALLIEKCLMEARKFGFKSCYLETMPYMKSAQKLYKRNGFNYIEAPLGNTGHTSCPVWMLKDLTL